MSFQFNNVVRLAFWVVPVAALMSFGSAQSQADPPGSAMVNCNGANPDSIAEALAEGATEIIVNGLCDEALLIENSNVRITGKNVAVGGPNAGDPLDGIDSSNNNLPAVRVSGALNVRLIDLKIIGGRGVQVDSLGRAIIANGVITPTSGVWGMNIGGSSRLSLIRSELTDKGILVSSNGSVFVRGSMVVGADLGPNIGQISLNLAGGANGSVTESTFVGRFDVQNTSNLNVSNSLETPEGNVVIDSPFPNIACFRFSTLRQQEAGDLRDDLGNPVTSGDVYIENIATGVPGCTLQNF